MKKFFILLLLLLSVVTPIAGDGVFYAKGKPAAKAKRDVTVYVTRTGSKYHESGCRYLRRSSIPMKLSEARLSYTACSVCKPPK